jgi:hypothetical protein
VSRQFTDGEISAAIDRIATEGGTLSRTIVRKRLGGGSSSRIDELLKDYRRNGGGAVNRASARRPTAEIAPPKTGPDPADQHAQLTLAASEQQGMRTERSSEELSNVELIARLESEIRILKILLESERRARADDAARHLQTIEALRHEIETYRAIVR